MKKSTLIIWALALAPLAPLRAQTSAPDEEAGLSSVVLASALAAPVETNPLQHLPGMSAARPAGGLPQNLITDFTNVPNPFDSREQGLDGRTAISYRLAIDARVSLEVYDLLGRKVRGWKFSPGINGGRQGINSILWDGTNETGRKVAKGGYLAELVMETPQTTVTAIRKIGVLH